MLWPTGAGLVCVAVLVPASACAPPPPIAAAAPAGSAASAPLAPIEVEDPLRAALRVVIAPLTAGGSARAYAGLEIGAPADTVLARGPAEVKSGPYPVGEAFPTRLVIARFGGDSDLAEVDLLDGVVVAVRGRAALDDAGARRDPVATCAAVVEVLGPRFGRPTEVTAAHVGAARDGCTVQYFLDSKDSARRLKLEVRAGDVVLEVRGDDSVAMSALEQSALALLEARKRAETCAMCRQLRPGQSVEHWYRVVSVDLGACTMKIKQISFGMSPPEPGRKLGEVTDAPCTTNDGY